MGRIELVARLALELWRASGERTAERLDALLHHFADQYALAGDFRAEAYAMAHQKAGLA